MTIKSGFGCSARSASMRFIDDEQYYRWLRVSLTFSIVLFMLAAPGLLMQEFAFAGVKFGAAGANLLRLFVLCGAAYAMLQYWVTSWMASRRATLFAPQDGVSAVARAKLMSEAAKVQLDGLRNFSAEIEKLPMLGDPSAIRIELGAVAFPGIAMRPAFSKLRWQMAETARSIVLSAQRPGERELSADELERIGRVAADLIIEELDERFAARLHTYETRVNQTAFQVGDLDGHHRAALERSKTTLDNAARALTSLDATMRRLDFTRDAKFVFLELVPTSVLFGLASYHYFAAFNPQWPTIFQYISP